jgi:hypothetical protein
MTPRELSIYMNAYADRRKIEHQERVAIAYNQACWTIQWLGKNKPEPLDKILDIKVEPAEMDDSEMLNAIMGLNAIISGKE